MADMNQPKTDWKELLKNYMLGVVEREGVTLIHYMVDLDSDDSSNLYEVAKELEAEGKIKLWDVDRP